MIQRGAYVRRLTLEQRADHRGAKGAHDTKSIRVICSAPPRRRRGRLYFSKLRVYLAREIAGNRPAEENIYCAVLSSHGKSEQRERILHRAGRSLPNGIPLFFDFLERFPVALFFSPRSPLSTYCISRDPTRTTRLGHPARTVRGYSLHGSVKTPSPEDCAGIQGRAVSRVRPMIKLWLFEVTSDLRGGRREEIRKEATSAKKRRRAV